jgi:hypothetical protein
MLAVMGCVIRGAFSVLSGRIGPWRAVCNGFAGVYYFFGCGDGIGDSGWLPRRARANFWCGKFAATFSTHFQSKTPKK